LSQCSGTGDGWSALATWEKDVGKTNDTVRELRDDELEKVSGGYDFTDVMVESRIVAPRDLNAGQCFSFGATQTGSF
jgi:hypothetical protein